MNRPNNTLNYLACILAGMAMGCVLVSHFVLMRPEPLGGAPDRVAAALGLFAAVLFTFARYRLSPNANARPAR